MPLGPSRAGGGPAAYRRRQGRAGQGAGCGERPLESSGSPHRCCSSPGNEGGGEASGGSRPRFSAFRRCAAGVQAGCLTARAALKECFAQLTWRPG